MPITFHIPGPLRQHTEGRSQVEIKASAANVAEALAVLWQAYPGLRDRVLTEQGEVRQHVNIFVAEENIRDHDGLAAVVKNGAVITIVPAVSGG
jgi:sulfur-carrier protein